MPMLLLGANSSNANTRTVAIDVWGRLYSTYGRDMDSHLKSGVCSALAIAACLQARLLALARPNIFILRWCTF